jgi:hypothetical protein
MRVLLAFCTLFLSFPATAQFSVAEADGRNRLRLLGRDFNMSFFSFAGIQTDKFNDQGGRIGTYNYMTFATPLSEFRFAVRLPFQYNTAGTDRLNGSKVNGQEVFLQDIIFGLQKHDAVLLPWDIETYWEGRLYLPTSKYSKQSGMIAHLRNTAIVSKVFNRYLELEYTNHLGYFVQSKAAYRASFEDADGYEATPTVATKQMDLDHWASLWGKVSATTGLGLQFGQEIEWKNEAPENNIPARRSRLLKAGPALRFPVSQNANFIFSYTDKADQDGHTKELGRFLATNTEFSLLSFIRF